jgi:hypothetical protein
MAVSHYILRRATNSGFTTGVVDTNVGNILTYDVTGLSPATTYYFKVKAVDTTGNEGEFCDPVSEATTSPIIPSSLSNLVRWYKADAIVGLSDGDAVVSWTDSSSSAVNGTQSNASKKPIYKTGIVNSLPVVRFDGSDDFLSIGNLSALTAGEVFIVRKIDNDPPTTGTGGIWYLGNSGGNSHVPEPSVGKIYEEFGTPSRKDAIVYTPNSFTAWHIYNVYSALNDYQIFYNTTSLYTSSSNTVDFPAAAKLGEGLTGGICMDGDIAEFFLFSRKLTGTERGQMISYIQDKYAI